MSGSTIGGVIGGIVGFYFGGPSGAQLGFAIGSAVGGYVDPVQIKGPRLSDATRQTSQEGIPIPWGYGTFPTTGNIIFAGPLVEHKHKERQKGGPEVTTYTYTRSYAIGVCEGPVAGLQKIKRNGKLVYDISQGSAIVAETAKFLEKCTIYLGDEDQMVDPTIEAVVGIGNTGPNRGLCYIVMEDDDLTDTQGAIAQYEFVVQKCGDVTTNSVPGALGYWKLNDANSGTALDWSGNNFNGTYNGTPIQTPKILGYSDGSTNFNGNAGVFIAHSIHGGALDVGVDGTWSVEFTMVLNAPPGPDAQMLVINHGSYVLGFSDFHVYLDPDGNLVAGYTQLNTVGCSVTYTGELIVGKAYHVVATKGAAGIFIYLNSQVVAYDAVSACALVTGGSVGWPGGDDGINFGRSGGGPYEFQGKMENVAVFDRQLSQSEVDVLYASRGPGITVPDSPGAYIDDDGNLVIDGVDSSEITDCYAILSDIVEDLCYRAGIDVATEVDTTGLDDHVAGFKCATESGADGFIGALTQAWFFDRAEWDKKLRFPKRGGAPVAALTMDDLTAQDGPAIKQTQIQEPELLRKVNVLTLDPAAGYNETKQSWERRAGTVKAKGEASIELPIVTDTDTAAQIAEKRGKIAWAETDKFGYGLTMKYSKLTPTDVVTLLDKKSILHRMRLSDMAEEAGVFDVLEAMKDRASVYDSTATGVPNPNTGGDTTPGLIGPTMFAAMNLPKLRTQDGSGMWVGMAGYLPGWHGAQLLMSIDGGVSYDPVFSQNVATTMGTLTADISAESEADSTGEDPLSVHAFGGQLESKTTAQVEVGGNATAVDTGGTAEVLAYETATETTTDYYDLTTLTRGMQGSRAAEHFTGDTFMDLSTAGFIEIDENLAGQVIYFKAVAFGISADAVDPVSVIYDPFAYLVYQRIDGNGDFRIDGNGDYRISYG